jgi:gliding motility-associated-like protein
MSVPLSTIFVTTAPNICAHTVTLSWNAYPTIGAGLAGYKIWQSAVGASGPYSLIGTVGPAVLNFAAGGMTTGNTYYYKVEAFDLSQHFTASSNRVSYFCPTPIPPSFLYLVSVSVSGSNRVDVTAYVDTAASVLGYKIMRADASNPLSFTEIGFVSSSTAPLFIYSDMNTDTDTKSYLYKVIAIDSCGFDGMNSNASQTILLTVKGNTDHTNTVTWNKYSSWGGRVTAFNVYRGLDGYIGNIPLVTTDSLILNDTTLYDDVWPELKGDGNFYYQIEAVEGAGNPYGFAAISKSNIAIAKQDLEYFIPNAFVPEAGVNTIWKPVIKWGAQFNYELNIFDRLGENIFTTKTYDKGWDGNWNGNKCESGVYIYTLRFNNATGDLFQKNGMITLIR